MKARFSDVQPECRIFPAGEKMQVFLCLNPSVIEETNMEGEPVTQYEYDYTEFVCDPDVTDLEDVKQNPAKYADYQETASDKPLEEKLSDLSSQLEKENKKLKAQLSIQSEKVTMLEECLLEVGEVIYA